MSNGSLPCAINANAEAIFDDGSIQIFDDCSTIDLPNEMPNEVLEMLQKTVVCGKRLNMTELTGLLSAKTLRFI
jgi:alpha-D-ribose 1-methylphosphonate 5-triphosphate synthase subunit PhnL